MKINRVTITGADDRNLVGDLKGLQEQYPFVEWGILFASGPGRPRYPSFPWIESLDNQGLKLSAHLCGDYAKQVVVRGDLSFINFYATQAVKFSRFQLNINFKRTKVDIQTLLSVIKQSPAPLIMQYNSNNLLINFELLNTPEELNIHTLFDASGGQGKPIGDIWVPTRYYTGYAGGIGPDNIREICERITIHSDNDEVFIDMESLVRTNDILDLDKVNKVLSVAKEYVELF